MQDELLTRLKQVAVNGEVACADAHAVGEALRLTPEQVGEIVNGDSELRFFRCQLGFFGYGLKSEGKSKIVLNATNMPEDLVQALLDAASDGQHIPCACVWQIADEFKYPRLGVANVVNSLDLMVTPCQLGCF